MLLVQHSGFNYKFILAQTLSFDPTVDINNAYVGALLLLMMLVIVKKSTNEFYLAFCFIQLYINPLSLKRSNISVIFVSK